MLCYKVDFSDHRPPSTRSLKGSLVHLSLVPIPPPPKKKNPETSRGQAVVLSSHFSQNSEWSLARSSTVVSSSCMIFLYHFMLSRRKKSINTRLITGVCKNILSDILIVSSFENVLIQKKSGSKFKFKRGTKKNSSSRKVSTHDFPYAGRAL